MPLHAASHGSLPEPYRIRAVEPIRLTSPEARRSALKRARYNLFRVRAAEVFIDLLTDSGVGAMSVAQWGAALQADESYAGSVSFERFLASVREVTGMAEVLPTHQGRAAERILFETLLSPGAVVLSNGLFDTTRANVERVGARGVDLPDPSALEPSSPGALKGGIDLGRLERALEREPVVLCILTCTSNGLGGHPVPVENVRQAAALCRKRGVRLFIDAARFAENAGLLVRRDPELRGQSARSVAFEIFSHADGCLMSAKKDGLAHIGGFLALRDAELAERLRTNLIVTEGFETYGGLAGRDLDAIALGLREALNDDNLAHRLSQVEAFHAALRIRHVPVVSPPGGHAVYVDAAAFAPHIPPELFPGQAVACALYEAAGVRSCELGTLAFGSRPGFPELLRLAIPWRTYTASHLEYVADALGQLLETAPRLRGFRLANDPPSLRHFRAALEPA